MSVVLLMVSCGFVSAVDYTWNSGGDGTTWASAANWGGSGFPDNEDSRAVIPAGFPDAITTAGARTIGELLMDAGCSATITVGGNFSIVTSGTENGFLTMSDGVFDCAGSDLRVDGPAYFMNGTLDASSGSPHVTVALLFFVENSNASYKATSGTTTLMVSSEVGGWDSGWAEGGLILFGGSHITHNNGTIQSLSPEAGANHLFAETADATTGIYNLLIGPANDLDVWFYYGRIENNVVLDSASGNLLIRIGSPTIGGDLTIVKGIFSQHSGGGELTVDGDVLISENGELDLDNSGQTATFGSLTLQNQNHKYRPPQGGTTVVNGNWNNSGGRYLHTTFDSTVIIATNAFVDNTGAPDSHDFYNLVIDPGAGNTGTLNSATVAGISNQFSVLSGTCFTEDLIDQTPTLSGSGEWERLGGGTTTIVCAVAPTVSDGAKLVTGNDGPPSGTIIFIR